MVISFELSMYLGKGHPIFQPEMFAIAYDVYLRMLLEWRRQKLFRYLGKASCISFSLTK